MADNYQLFSEIIPTLTQEERALAERVLGCTQQQDRAGDAAKILKEAGLNMDAVDLDDWPGFQWSIDSPDSELWLYGEEFGNVSHVAEFVRAFLARFRPADCWQLTWAETCSKPRIGEFGGGGLFVTASRVSYCVPHDWLRRRKKKFERAAQSGGLPARS
jgi:hypothetical protein